MKIREHLDKSPRARVYCGCIGWVSGFPRATEGRKVIIGPWLYYRCDECGKTYKKLTTPALNNNK